MNALRFLGVRLLELCLTFFAVVVLLFYLFRIAPGDAASMIIDPKMTQEAKARIRAQFGLDKPISEQFVLYLQNLRRGELGVSFAYQRPVWDLIKERLPNTLVLFTTATVLSFFIGFFVGRWMAWNPRREMPLIYTGVFLYTVFLPWFGLMMIYIFSYKLGWFPLSGMRSPMVWVDPTSTFAEKTLDFLHHLTLPLFVLVILGFPGAMLLTRNSMLEVLGEDYVLLARAKGLPDRRVRDRHAARAALLPLATSFSLGLAFSISGGVLTEMIFSWPGLGKELVDAVVGGDHPMAQGAFIFIAVVVLAANFITDVIYLLLDPRVRL